jgi:hypothetical protein
MRKKLPIGISTLSKMIRDGYVYVDKTRYVYEMASSGVYYFLSRPRRFGKTLFVDTLKEAFEGNREIFRGLWIYDHWDWDKKHPVIHISFGSGVVRDRIELDNKIRDFLYQSQERLGIQCRDAADVALCFGELIRKAKTQHGLPAVILIDEYDKPILDNIGNPERATELREGLKNIYSVMKDHDAYIQFVFLTGVSKFSKVSIFSGLNNLNDITIDKKYASICGYTEEELKQYFQEYLHGKEMEAIRSWYNGYNWTGPERVYNPFSLLNYFDKEDFRNYWFETGTPSFLIELFKKKHYYIPQLENLEVGESILGSFDVDFIEPENILFQTGYLTIDQVEFDGSTTWYKLRYPNHEVKRSLQEYILYNYTPDKISVSRHQKDLKSALLQADIHAVRDIMRAHFASIPHDWYRKNHIDQYEGYYASVFYAYFASIGVDVRVEDPTHYGQVDMAVLMPEVVYVFEFKVIDGEEATGEALAQLQTKGYAEKYRALGRQVWLVGIEFSKRLRQIVGVAVENIPSLQTSHEGSLWG